MRRAEAKPRKSLVRKTFVWSAKGNCYDNACAESFLHTLKVEMIQGESFATREDMRRAVFEYIEVDYNRTRRHSANGYISALAFENKMVA